MKRLAEERLHQWKAASPRKPLLIRGARQVGKTYLLKAFGAAAFPQVHYVNFEEDERFARIFERDLHPRRIVDDLRFHFGRSIAVAVDGAGDVVEVGEAVTQWKKGDRVFVSHHVPCNMCRYCVSGHHSTCDTLAATNFDPGGFSEFLRVPAINVRNGLYKLPDSMTYDEAVFIEPLACVIRGQEHAGWLPGRRGLVIGSGIAGIMHIQLARLSGASRVLAVDINESRLEAAQKFGADVVLPASDELPELVEQNNEINL